MPAKKYHPFVSVCTPTFNRRPFIENAIKCYKNQDYPTNRMEWVVIDDGTDCVRDLFDNAGIVNLKYFYVKKMHLGAKRNFMHTKAKGSIIVYMDDDDYYPPDRVSHAVETLTNNPDALCAGSSEIYIYFKGLKRMVQFGPYGPNHATAGTFAFRKRLLDQTQYDDKAAIAEERAFLKEYTIPFVQLDPMKTILVFSHEHNTFDKRELLKNPHPKLVKDSTKKVEDFIKKPSETSIIQFFMEDIDGLLENYEPGRPINKPEVIKQTAEIKKKRAEMEEKLKEDFKNEATGITLDYKGVKGKDLTRVEVLDVIKTLSADVRRLTDQVKENPMLVRKDANGNDVNITSVQLLDGLRANETRLKSIVDKYNDLVSVKQSIEKEKETLEKEKETLEKEKETLESRLDKATSTQAEMQSSLDKMKDVITSLGIEKRQLQEKCKGLEQQLQKNPSAMTPSIRIIADPEG